MSRTARSRDPFYTDIDEGRATAGRLAEERGKAVSEQNVELVRAIYTMWNHDEPVAHLLDPDFEYVNPPYAVEPGVRRGGTELDKVRTQMLEVYPDYRFEAERFVDAGEAVVIIGVARGTSGQRCRRAMAPGVRVFDP